MSKLIIIVEKNGHYSSHLSGGMKIINEEDLSLDKLIKTGQFFSKCGGYISTVEGVKKELEHSGWVKFASSL